MKLKSRRFDAIEVIEAESQVMLNTITEYYFEMHLKAGRSPESGAYARKGTISRVTVVNRPKPRHYGWLFPGCVMRNVKGHENKR
jgi:hypothetical protein